MESALTTVRRKTGAKETRVNTDRAGNKESLKMERKNTEEDLNSY